MSYLLIDIGNSAAKLDYAVGTEQTFLTLPRNVTDWEKPLNSWFDSVIGLTSNWSQCQIHVSSVCPELWDRLSPLLKPTMSIKLWNDYEVPIEADVVDKNAVGSDRLFAALYAATVKSKNRSALVSNIGTAQTVDVVSPDGRYCGGQIVPGVHIALEALHKKTAFLPKIDQIPEDTIATSCGKSTRQAMEFGAINVACGIIERMKRLVKEEFDSTPVVFVSGGAGKVICNNLGIKANYVENMTLQGMLIAAKRLDQNKD